MGNYNPRQNTRMRFKDERELEKFIFISGEFGFGSEVLEEASKHEPWSKITNILVNGKLEEPILLHDISDNTPYIGYKDSDTILLNNLEGNTNYTVELIYNQNEDKLTINKAEDELLSADNVKTLFGNQSIIGQGNIDLYVHHLLINSNCYFTIYSSNNLNVDTPEKLTTLLKDKNTSIYYFGYQQTQYIYNVAISFNAATNLWQIRVSGEETSSEITDVTDIVTTI